MLFSKVVIPVLMCFTNSCHYFCKVCLVQHFFLLSGCSVFFSLRMDWLQSNRTYAHYHGLSYLYDIDLRTNMSTVQRNIITM